MWPAENDKALEKFLAIIEEWSNNLNLCEGTKLDHITKDRYFIGRNRPHSFKEDEKYKFEWRKGPLYTETFYLNEEIINVIICKYNTRVAGGGDKISVKLWRFQTVIINPQQTSETCIYWCEKSNVL